MISIILIVCLLINIIYFILNIASLFNLRFIYYNDKISTCDFLKIINISSCNNKEDSVKPTRKMIFARIVMTGWNIFFARGYCGNMFLYFVHCLGLIRGVMRQVIKKALINCLCGRIAALRGASNLNIFLYTPRFLRSVRLTDRRNKLYFPFRPPIHHFR